MEIFSKESRVRLYYMVLDCLPPPITGEFGLEGGQGICKLDELLRKRFGRLSLASGQSIETVILNFILSAAEDELLTLIEFIPGTYIATEAELNQGFTYSRHWNHDANRHAEELANGLNGFLEIVGSPARFAPDGRFIRDGVAIEIPAELANLPDKEALIADLRNLLKPDQVLSRASGTLRGLQDIDRENAVQKLSPRQRSG